MSPNWSMPKSRIKSGSINHLFTCYNNNGDCFQQSLSKEIWYHSNVKMWGHLKIILNWSTEHCVLPSAESYICLTLFYLVTLNRFLCNNNILLSWEQAAVGKIYYWIPENLLQDIKINYWIHQILWMLPEDDVCLLNDIFAAVLIILMLEKL